LEVISPTDSDYAQEVRDLKSDLLDINNLIDKLLFLSRLRKEFVKHDELVNLKGLLEFIKDKLSKDLLDKSINLNLDINDGVFLKMPREYAEVLFTNLISNSLKYSKQNTVITIKTKKLNESIVVTITDQGIGMSEDELTKIFDRFYRGSEGKKLSEGSGIGLSIVKRLCDLYEIDLRINSKKNEGTTFVLEFKS
jgi:signal transduction histidine kinase